MEGERQLKVHKNENFFGFDFDFCTASLLIMHKYDWATMGGGRIIPRSLKATGNKKKFQPRPKIFILF